MIRGTTPTLYFKLNNIDDLSTISDIWVTFRNIKKSISARETPNGLTKKYSEEEVVLNETDKVIEVTLTQKDTLKFDTTVQAQIKILFEDDTVCASNVFNISVGDILNTGIMSNEVEEPEPEPEPTTPDDGGEETPTPTPGEGEGGETPEPGESEGGEETPEPGEGEGEGTTDPEPEPGESEGGETPEPEPSEGGETPEPSEGETETPDPEPSEEETESEAGGE